MCSLLHFSHVFKAYFQSIFETRLFRCLASTTISKHYLDGKVSDFLVSVENARWLKYCRVYQCIKWDLYEQLRHCPPSCFIILARYECWLIIKCFVIVVLQSQTLERKTSVWLRKTMRLMAEISTRSLLNFAVSAPRSSVTPRSYNLSLAVVSVAPMHGMGSLVPRPSPAPVFDRSAVCKNGGRRPGESYLVIRGTGVRCRHAYNYSHAREKTDLTFSTSYKDETSVVDGEHQAYKTYPS